MAFAANPGCLPSDAIGKRVRVMLANGTIGAEDPRSDTPPGWPADGPNGCRWSITGHPFDIGGYEVL